KPAEDIVVGAAELSPEAAVRLKESVERRAAREPLAYILGQKEFWSLEFFVGPGVLVPRPESETLLDEFLKVFRDRSQALNILDLGTGSGCLLVAALSMFPNATGVGIDTSDVALDWARRNVSRHGFEGRSLLIQQDWREEMGDLYDAILANPPYIRRSAISAL